MTLYRVLDGSVKQDGRLVEKGGDVELSAEEAARINKNGRKTVEKASVVIAEAKAEADKRKAIDKAKKEAEEEAELGRLEAEEEKAKKAKAEADKKKGGSQ